MIDLYQLPKYGTGIGRKRMQWLCAEALQSDWAKKIDPINVVGTNGKGSTTTILSAILTELGIGNGRYTSPHFFEFNERICIDNQPITNSTLERLIQTFQEKKDQFHTQHPNEEIAFFEAITSVAIQYFYEQQTEAVLLEAGIGGRYDSTKVLTGSIAILTSIDLEHTQLLGNTAQEIAQDKMDICSEGHHLIVGNVDKDLLPSMKAYARSKNIQLYPIQEHCEVNFLYFQPTKMSMDFSINGLAFTDIHSNLVGEHQISNILAATLALNKWLEKHYPDLAAQKLVEATRSALSKISFPGRFERIQTTPSVFIDAAHTPQAIDYLIDTVTEIKENPLLLITGVSEDKNPYALVAPLCKIADTVICTRAYHRGLAVSKVWEVVTNAAERPIPIFSVETIEEAVQGGLQYAKQNKMDVLVAGGLFLAAEAKAVVHKHDPKQLIFK